MWCGTEIREIQPEEVAEVATFTNLVQAGQPGLIRLVAILNGGVVGYVEMATTFFHQPFIGLLRVRPEHCRQGIATALMKAMEAKCQGEKLFTSTNDSNSAMQAFLAKLGYRRCGSVEELDEGDPELIFFKCLRRSS